MKRTDPRDAARLSLPVFLLLALFPACRLEQTYAVRGRVVGFGDDARTVIVAHENVQGLMPAMTMPFKVIRPDALDGVEQGSVVRFTLTVTRDSSWIDEVTLLPSDTALELEQEDAPAHGLSSPVLQAGDRVPAFALLNQDGEPIHLSDFEGKALLITFLYTRCPLPDYCPLIAHRFSRLQPLLEERFGDRAALLSISFDANDTPDVLRAYAQRYTQHTDSWAFATGTKEQIQAVTAAFGVGYSAAGDAIDHNLVTVLVGPNGRVWQRWRGSQWQESEVLEGVAASLREEKGR